MENNECQVCQREFEEGEREQFMKIQVSISLRFAGKCRPLLRMFAGFCLKHSCSLLHFLRS